MEASTHGQSLLANQWKTPLNPGHEHEKLGCAATEGRSKNAGGQGLPLALAFGLLGGLPLALAFAIGLLGGQSLPVVANQLPPTNSWQSYAQSSLPLAAATSSVATTT